MLRQLQVRAAPITNRAADYAPAVPACCNICRTCTATNVMALVGGAAIAVGAGVGALVKRVARA
jgi:exosortase/archaeosortase